MRVAPFGYPRIDGYVLLPAAFRSLSRPSSAPSAKASALCSSSLDHFSAYASVHMRQRRLPPSPASGCFCFMLCYLAITLDVFLFFVAQIPVESFLLSSGLFLRICGFQGASMPFLMSWRPPALPHRLLSRTVSSAVPSAGRVLTVVFGMGTGVSPGRIAARSFQLHR